jgi:hypothetical protein
VSIGDEYGVSIGDERELEDEDIFGGRVCAQR